MTENDTVEYLEQWIGWNNNVFVNAPAALQVIAAKSYYNAVVGSEVIMTEKEKELIMALNHPVYTVEYLEQWTGRNDNVFVNAPAALQAVAAKSYYEAVQQMVLKEMHLKENTGTAES